MDSSSKEKGRTDIEPTTAIDLKKAKDHYTNYIYSQNLKFFLPIFKIPISVLTH